MAAFATVQGVSIEPWPRDFAFTEIGVRDERDLLEEVRFNLQSRCWARVRYPSGQGFNVRLKVWPDLPVSDE